jgi:hypothetical protein
MTLDLDDLESKAKAATPGPWNVFVCDDGKQWTGWPLCISATNVLNSNGDERVIVRTGGFYPYEWDHGTSQDEANANAAHIAAANPATMLALIARIRELEAEKARLVEALTPSGDTKAAYHGEFSFSVTSHFWNDVVEEWETHAQNTLVPWTTVKEIMAAIRARAAIEVKHDP